MYIHTTLLIKVGYIATNIYLASSYYIYVHMYMYVCIYTYMYVLCNYCKLYDNYMSLFMVV